MPMRSLLVVYGCERAEYNSPIKSLNLNPSVVLKLPVHDVCCSYKYASDLIWMLGKNNLDSFQSLPVASDTGKD
jgi:hypothetical protein